MFAPFPPSSRLTLLKSLAAFCDIKAPALVDPVNEIMFISGWLVKASPVVAPSPLTKLKTPGGKPDGIDKGYFVKPTAFADVNNQMEIARTEIFGPVLSIIPFENEEEAISIANDTDYGLTNYIQTKDKEKANRVARRLRSGMVDVNGAGIAVDAPFGGFKHSGIGREAGKEGLLEFLEVKSVGGWAN